MDKIAKKNKTARRSSELESLRLENESLAGQIKRLFKAESKLYAYQEQLDAQLREYKGLYELNRRLIGTFNIGEMFENTCEYVIDSLEYERVLIFQQTGDSSGYAVCALDGYYDAEEKDRVGTLFIGDDDPLLLPLHKGNDYLLCTPCSTDNVLIDFRERLGMNEYLIFPLISHTLTFALLAAGNTAENAGFYRRISDNEGALLGIGNLVGLISSSLENRILYANLNDALEQTINAEARYRTIFENAAEGIFQASAEGRFINCNPATAEILGYESPDELITAINDIEQQLYVDPSRHRALLEMLQDRSNVKNYEVEFYKKDGKRQWTSLSAQPTLDENGKIIYINAIMLDIAERKRVEELITNSLREKELLLREIHHRVKNNLQIITTLMDLQTFSITDNQSKKFLRECQDRIRSIALIHEKLYETTDFVFINFAEYLDNLVHHLFGMYIPDDRITLTVQAADITLGIDEAIPCGLIVNELVTNSLKYAFPYGCRGELSIRLCIDEDDMVKVTIADNGVGLPSGLDYTNTETLGLQLVNLLVKQIKGKLELISGPGTAFEIIFHRRTSPKGKESITGSAVRN